MTIHILMVAYHREPPVVKFLDHLLSFLFYSSLAAGSWVVYDKTLDGLRPEFFLYTVALAVACGVASLGALLDHYRFELVMLPFIVALLFIYALSLLALPDELQGVFFITAMGLGTSKRLLHLMMVASKSRKANTIENAVGFTDGVK